MTLHVSTHGDVVLIETARGPITDWRKIEALDSTLRAQVEAGHKKILLDLAHTEFMTSRTIGVLVGIQANAFKHGAALYLCNVTKRIRDTLLILWLLRALNVLGTREEAMAFLSELKFNLAADDFAFHAGRFERFSGHLTFSWPNTGSLARVSQENCGGGFATLHVRDAANHEVYVHNLGFRPSQGSVEVKLGVATRVTFVAHNRSNKTLVGRAVYNDTPYQAGPFFYKIQCFCFTNEKLGPGETAVMPVLVFIDKAYATDPTARLFDELTLSYTFYPKNDLTPEAIRQARDLATGSKLEDAAIHQNGKQAFDNDAPRR